ncbi:UNVERIFIED_CONTAM: hypothetical protein K2H54_027509 [Gekko kuhli]
MSDFPLRRAEDEAARWQLRFEESQGRSDSKTIFYQALQNSLGGEDSNPVVQDAASWFYSLQHSSDDYASFSRALENATRDHFIICPTIEMAKHWAGSGRGNVFMYHVPESSSSSRSRIYLAHSDGHVLSGVSPRVDETFLSDAI